MHYKEMIKRVSAISLAAVMGISMLPASAIGGQEVVLADEGSSEGEEASGKKLVEGKLSHVWVHDPSIAADTDSEGKKTYYVFGSHISGAKSTDLANWQSCANGYAATGNTLFGDLEENLKEPFAWAGNHDGDQKNGYGVWAPDVKWNPDYVWPDGSGTGAYMMYLCTSSTGYRSATGFAVSHRIDGDYQYVKTLVYSGFTKDTMYNSSNMAFSKSPNSYSRIDLKWTNTNIDELIAEGRLDDGLNEEWFKGSAGYNNTSYTPNAIDPTIFRDAEGKMWMTYGSWRGGIFLLEIDPKTGDAIYPKSNGKTADGRAIDKYFGTQIAGGLDRSGEGPYIMYDKESGYYYLYTTYNGLEEDKGYNMRLFRSEKPDGPYLDAAGNNAVFFSGTTDQYSVGIKVMGNYNIAGSVVGYKAPGHCSTFIDDGQMYLFYHTRFQSGYGFETRVHQQFLNEDKWPVTAVFENRNDVISENGYTKEEIVGSYDFINHGNTPDFADVKTGKSIVLKADGTIAGDAEGTWEEKANSYYATIKIDGAEYKGVFFKQHDERGTKEARMTFTAIGSNNQTIWGAKISDSDAAGFAPEGDHATDFSKIKTQPVEKFTFDNEEGITKLVGKAQVADGVLKLEAENAGKAETYAELPETYGMDFSKGVTLTADIAVKEYTSDWTPIFMISDATVGSGEGNYAYHFTQGFSSVTDYHVNGNSKQLGYYGNAVAQPYSWDYFNDFFNRNQWLNVTVTITAKQMNTYINGVKVQSGQADYKRIMKVFGNAEHVYLGGSVFADPDFSGWMDNVGIYNVALTDQAVAALASDKTIDEGAAEYVTDEEYAYTADERWSVQKEEAARKAEEEAKKAEEAKKEEGAKKAEEAKKEEEARKAEEAKKAVPAKGSTIKDASGNVYKVVKAGSTVSFKAPKNKKVTSAKVPAKAAIGNVSYKVTEISDNAFKNCKKLKSVTIGSNVTAIGKNAFAGCIVLNKVTIPAKVTKIGGKAFYGDKKLKTVTIKSSKLKKASVGGKAFGKIHSKAVVKVPKAKKSLYKQILKAKGFNGKKQRVK